jgi:hypothetical protein
MTPYSTRSCVSGTAIDSQRLCGRDFGASVHGFTVSGGDLVIREGINGPRGPNIWRYHEDGRWRSGWKESTA